MNRFTFASSLRRNPYFKRGVDSVTPVLQVIAVTSCDPLRTDTDANSILNRARVPHKYFNSTLY